jgi:hypothetical protein
LQWTKRFVQGFNMLSTLLLIHSREVSKNVTNVTISIIYASLFAFF